MKREPVFLFISNYYIYINPFAPIKKHPYFFVPHSLSLSLLVCFVCVYKFSLSFFSSLEKGLEREEERKSFFIFIFGDNPKRKERKFRVPLCCEVKESERESKERMTVPLSSRLCLPLTTTTTSLSSSSSSCSSSDFPSKSLKTLHTASPNFSLHSPSSPSSSSFPHSQHTCTRKHKRSLSTPTVFSLTLCVWVNLKCWVLLILMFWMQKLVNFCELGRFFYSLLLFGMLRL